MGYWDEGYKREEHSRIDPGDYRVQIISVEESTSRSSGNPMLIVTVRPNGSDIKIKHYIVKNAYYNRNMTELKDSFGIADNDFILASWVGAVGAARLIEDENGYLKVRRFLNPKQQEKLPPWEGPVPARQTVSSTPSANEFEEIPMPDEDDLPF